MGSKVQGFKPALVRRDVAMKLHSHSMGLAFNHHILTCQLWAMGSFLVPGLHLGCLFTTKVSASSGLIQNLEPNWQLFGEMSIFSQDSGIHAMGPDAPSRTAVPALIRECDPRGCWLPGPRKSPPSAPECCTSRPMSFFLTKSGRPFITTL